MKNYSVVGEWEGGTVGQTVEERECRRLGERKREWRVRKQNRERGRMK